MLTNLPDATTLKEGLHEVSEKSYKFYRRLDNSKKVFKWNAAIFAIISFFSYFWSKGDGNRGRSKHTQTAKQNMAMRTWRTSSRKHVLAASSIREASHVSGLPATI